MLTSAGWRDLYFSTALKIVSQRKIFWHVKGERFVNSDILFIQVSGCLSVDCCEVGNNFIISWDM